MLSREATQEGIHITAGLYNALLYVTTGGNNWEHYARDLKGPPPPSTSAVTMPVASTLSPSSGSVVCPPTDGDVLPIDAENSPPGPPLTKEELISATDAVWSHMQAGTNEIEFYCVEILA